MKPVHSLALVPLILALLVGHEESGPSPPERPEGSAVQGSQPFVEAMPPPRGLRSSIETAGLVPAPGGPTAEASETPPPSASLEVWILDPAGAPLTVEVSFRPDGGPAKEPWIPLAQGAHRVENAGAYWAQASPGSYQIQVEGLPPATLPPPNRHNRSVRSISSSFRADVELAPGPNRRTYQLEQACWVEGRVADGSGLGIADAIVCASLQDSEVHRKVYARTDARGLYQLSCPSGRQRINVQLESDHPWSDMARPFPKTVQLEPGAIAHADFALQKEGASVTGRIVDADGAAIPDLDVLAYYKPEQESLPDSMRLTYTLRDRAQRTRTRADGSFELAGLPAHRVAVQVGPDDYQPVGRGRLGSLVPRHFADLRRAAQVDLGVVEVNLSRPYRLSARIELMGSWQGRQHEAVGDLQVTVHLPAGARRKRPAAQEGRLKLRGGVLTFDWICEPPEGEVLLEIRDPAGQLTWQLLTPVPDGVDEPTLTFPQPE